MITNKQPRYAVPSNIESYENIAKYLFSEFLDDKLPAYVYDDPAMMGDDLLAWIRKYADQYKDRYQLKARIRTTINCEYPGKYFFAFRLIRFCADDTRFYQELRREFLDIKSSSKDNPLYRMMCLCSALPYFRAFDNDDEIRKPMLEYLENDKEEIIKITLRYFGGKENWPEGFIKVLNNDELRCKHWTYIWSFKAICEEGLFDNTVKNQLKDVIGKYANNQNARINDFEKKIINEALVC